METVRTVHQKLRRELTDYLKAQYIRRNSFLLSALDGCIDIELDIINNPETI